MRRHAEDLARLGAVEGVDAGAESEIDGHQQCLADGDAGLDGGHYGQRARVGHDRRQHLRPDDVVDVRVAPAMAGIERADVDQLLQRGLAHRRRRGISIPEDPGRGEVQLGRGGRRLQRRSVLFRQVVAVDDDRLGPVRIDRLRCDPRRLQDRLDLLPFHSTVRLKVADGPATTDQLLELHAQSPLDPRSMSSGPR